MYSDFYRDNKMSGISNTTALTSIANSSLSNFSNAQPIEEAIQASSVSSALNKNDSIKSSVSTGTVPATRLTLSNKISNTTSSIANNTVTLTRNTNKFLETNVMPKAEPLSVTLVRNKFLSAVLVGGFVNGITTLMKVSEGKYTPQQAQKEVVKNTAIGAFSGLTFATGMGATASLIGRFAGGVPLSLAALTVGSIASYFSTEFVKNNVAFFSEKNPVA